MTEFDIQRELFGLFCTLNEFSGVGYLETDSDGNYLNVHLPNVPFSEPSDNRWFDLTFKSNEPSDASLGRFAQSRITGVLFIDIITNHDDGEHEAEEKYKWIAKLFNCAELDYIDIMRVYVANKGNEADHYRTLVAVEWEADIDKEIAEGEQ